ncbi:DDB1- and CUL4-associated factor 13, partial [Clonorchis sinensis]
MIAAIWSEKKMFTGWDISTDIPVFKNVTNYDASEHPFAAEREYVRAVNAAKLQRMMAKPFLGALEGTTEQMVCLSLNSETLGLAVFGTADGKIQYWDIATRKLIFETRAHDCEIRGICHYNKSRFMYTCSLDGQLKQWRMNHDDIVSAWSTPLTTVLLRWTPHCLDHHPCADELLVGGTESCLLYNAARMDVPIREWSWGQEPIHCAKFNQVEFNVACTLTKDNSLMLIDCRQDRPIRKVKMDLKLNSFCWNPMEPFIFTAASEDYNVYTYDTRYFKFPRRVYRGHVNAVLDIDYSPTGREFVTGSYDSTIRLWHVNDAESFDVYHSRRMKRVLGVRFTLDTKFVLSSSSDQNVRVWKAHASEKLGPIQPREKASINLAEALREKFKDHPEVRKILKKRHVPKPVLAATREHTTIRAKWRRKERNIRVFNKKDIPYVPEKDKHTSLAEPVHSGSTYRCPNRAYGYADLLPKYHQGTMCLWKSLLNVDFLRNESLPVIFGCTNTTKRRPLHINLFDYFARQCKELPFSITQCTAFFVAHNDDCLDLEYDSARWECPVCFTTKLGTKFFRFRACKHRTCMKCVRQSFICALKDGLMEQRMACLLCGLEAEPNEARQVLPSTEYDRYERLLLNRALNRMSDIAFCPRPGCNNNPVILDYKDLGRCTICEMAFCPRCNCVSHGMQKCPKRSSESDD